MSYRDLPHYAILRSAPRLSGRVEWATSGDVTRLSTANCSLDFKGGSADLVAALKKYLDGHHTLVEISIETKYSSTTIAEHLFELSDEMLLFWSGAAEHLDDVELYLSALRMEASFWNAHIFMEPLAKRLFSGGASFSEVMRWGVEFFRFVAAANTYMPLALSHYGYVGLDVEDAVQHYVDEADHDEIFKDGLLASGISNFELEQGLPLAGTNALIDYLCSAAETSIFSYMAVFSVMQASRNRPSVASIHSRYDHLREAYIYARRLFDAFEKHDALDSGFGHSEWTLEKWVRRKGVPAQAATQQTSKSMEFTAECFCIFYRDIERNASGKRVHEKRIAPGPEAVIYSE